MRIAREVRGYQGVTVVNECVSSGGWPQIICAAQPNPSRLDRKRSPLHGLNLCVFAALREIFSDLVAAMPFCVCLVNSVKR